MTKEEQFRDMIGRRIDLIRSKSTCSQEETRWCRFVDETLVPAVIKLNSTLEIDENDIFKNSSCN